ncbi:MAG: hypothetical protein AB7P04_12660 [Bacteriovoracia bacterium]
MKRGTFVVRASLLFIMALSSMSCLKGANTTRAATLANMIARNSAADDGGDKPADPIVEEDKSLVASLEEEEEEKAVELASEAWEDTAGCEATGKNQSVLMAMNFASDGSMELVSNAYSDEVCGAIAKQVTATGTWGVVKEDDSLRTIKLDTGEAALYQVVADKFGDFTLVLISGDDHELLLGEYLLTKAVDEEDAMDDAKDDGGDDGALESKK